MYIIFLVAWITQTKHSIVDSTKPGLGKIPLQEKLPKHLQEKARKEKKKKKKKNNNYVSVTPTRKTKELINIQEG